MFAPREPDSKTGIAKSSARTWTGPERAEAREQQHFPEPGRLEQRCVGNDGLQRIPRHTVQRITCEGSCGGTCSGCRKPQQKQQGKLRVGPVDDVYEQDAERVAGQVMRMPGTLHEGIVDNPVASGIRRLPATGGQEADSDARPSVSAGRPLSPEIRHFMEQRFGADFSSVRLHTGPEAQRSAAALQARAFTYGNHVTLGEGASETDRGLMAHELAHVVQQGALDARPQDGRLVSRFPANGRIQRDPPPAPSAPSDPCPGATQSTRIDVFAVSLPGATRSVDRDVARANAIWAQCCAQINLVGGESWDTNILDQDAPAGVLNAPSGTVRALTAEELAMLANKPGGAGVIHAYYVPSFSGPKVAESFWPSQHGEQAFAMANTARPDSFAHELGHVLFDSGSHDGDPDNLMASGTTRNVGVDKLEPPQCGRL